MTTYSVHLPAQATPGSTTGLEEAVLVKDGFHWLALFFPLLWLLFNRLWWALLGFLALTIGVVLTGRAAGINDQILGALDVLLGFFVALSAADLKSWGLARRGYRLADVVTGSSRDEAERRFFDRWLGRESVRPVAPTAAKPGSRPAAVVHPEPQVLGLFPDSGAAR